MKDARVAQTGKLKQSEVSLRVPMDDIDGGLQSPQAEKAGRFSL